MIKIKDFRIISVFEIGSAVLEKFGFEKNGNREAKTDYAIHCSKQLLHKIDPKKLYILIQNYQDNCDNHIFGGGGGGNHAFDQNSPPLGP